MPYKQPDPAKRWQKGRSGNPKGQPPKTLTQVLAEIGDGTNIDGVLEITDSAGKKTRIVIDAESKKTNRGRVRTLKYMVGARLYQLALTGDLGAIKEINNRLDGAIKTVEEVTGANGYSPEDIARAFTEAMVSTTGSGIIAPAAGGVDGEPGAV